jgi:hypothetical protein
VPRPLSIAVDACNAVASSERNSPLRHARRWSWYKPSTSSDVGRRVLSTRAEAKAGRATEREPAARQTRVSQAIGPRRRRSYAPRRPRSYGRYRSCQPLRGEYEESSRQPGDPRRPAAAAALHGKQQQEGSKPRSSGVAAVRTDHRLGAIARTGPAATGRQPTNDGRMDR